MTREANQRVAEKAKELKFVSRVPFLCECGDPGCSEFVLLRWEDYVARPDGVRVTHAAHSPAAARRRS